MNAPSRADEFRGPDLSAEVIAEFVRQQSGGVDAIALHDHYKDQGYDAAAIQRALRSALDRGYIRLGDALQMVA